MTDAIETVFGTYSAASRGRLDLTYDYETAAIYSFKKILTEIGATTLLDIGANIGVYSIFCSDLPSLRAIHAFEPAPVTHSMLCTNVSLQRRNSTVISAHQIAASSKAGTVSFKIVAPTSGANAIVETREEGLDYIEVKAATVDSILHIRGERVGVKIDVEGHEGDTIWGMEALLRHNECYIQVEALREDRTSRIKQLLEEYGYEYIFSLRDDHLFLHKNLMPHLMPTLAILAQCISSDLRDLMNLRREKRSIAVAARKLREMSGYKKDPLFLPQEADPF
ncbi:FkbM family methyltransferase [Ensifer adhaerens]|uniref:FkbM family methyltransferase n=1 Tax=Ensifer adhaerens TaxID=106592 RepID=UPI00384EC7B5